MGSRSRFPWAGMLGVLFLMVLGVPSVKGTDYFDATSPEELVGTWTTKAGKTECVITFSADGTFRGKNFQGDVLEDEYTGTWKLERTSCSKKGYCCVPQKLSYEYLASKTVPAGTKDENVVFGRVFEEGTQSLWLRFLTKSGVERSYKKLAQE